VIFEMVVKAYIHRKSFAADLTEGGFFVRL